jgi:hypothetical protein
MKAEKIANALGGAGMGQTGRFPVHDHRDCLSIRDGDVPRGDRAQFAPTFPPVGAAAELSCEDFELPVTAVELAATAIDTVTVIRARNRRLAKLIRGAGVVEAYDLARTFDFFEAPVADLVELERLLRRLACSGRT